MRRTRLAPTALAVAALGASMTFLGAASSETGETLPFLDQSWSERSWSLAKLLDEATDGAFVRWLRHGIEALFGGANYFFRLANTDPELRREWDSLLVRAMRLNIGLEDTAVDPNGLPSILRLVTPKVMLVDAIAPEMNPGGRLERFAERQGDIGVGRTLHDILERPDGGRGVTFYFYQGYLEEHGVDASEGLIAYMMRVDPFKAMDAVLKSLPRDERSKHLEAMQHHHLVQRTVWSREHEVGGRREDAEAARSLEKLTQLGPWWVRMYAACVARDHRHLATQQLLHNFAGNEHPAIRDALKGVLPPDPIPPLPPAADFDDPPPPV